MTLDLAALTTDVQVMGETLVQTAQARQSMLELARERLEKYAGELSDIKARVELTREKNLHWRGAYPAADEPLNTRRARPDMPPRVNIIANDGSQVPIDPHAAALYYAINIGYIVYPYGAGGPPTVNAAPSLHFQDHELFDGDRLISNAVVNARRTVRELENLANLAEAYVQMEPPVVVMSDGPLMWVQPGDTPQERRENLEPYLASFDRLQDARVVVGGYIDRPRSTGLLSLLHLMSLESVSKEKLAQTDLVGLSDARLFAELLDPGERSALFIRQSPTNAFYASKGHEIWHFYVNVGAHPARPLIARVEMPAWTAQDPARCDLLHAAIWQQCQIVGGYPYVLARAHELALISTDERRDLEQMVIGVLRRQGLDPRPSEKAWQKSLTGGAKRSHRL